MNRGDEMERSIQLRATAWGYRTVLLALAVWTLYNCWQTLAHGAAYRVLPGLILCLAVSVQSFAQLALRQKMVAGDEEYREPNHLLRTVVAAVAITVLLLFVGTYLVLKV